MYVIIRKTGIFPAGKHQAGNKQAMSKQTEELKQIGERILDSSRTELYLSMHFMGEALGSLQTEMDLSTTRVGTDAVSIRYNPSYLRQLFLESPQLLNRTYIHMVLHCLFRHMFSSDNYEDADLYDLCADICVESVVDTMDYPAIARLYSQLREDGYEKLTEQVHVLTAPRLYEYFTAHPLTEQEEKLLRREFGLCDHGFWARMEKKPPQEEQQNPESVIPPLKANVRRADEEEWKKHAKRALRDLNTVGNEKSGESGSLSRILSLETQSLTDYREFLQRFAVMREEVRIDPDSFDYGFYNYGLQLYGDLPLIEENEVREARRIDQLVIAIDTSASCDRVLVQRFLSETAAILKSQENFFHRTDIHILECDDKLQKDIRITDLKEIDDYMREFEVRGGFGTDFRPVFEYVRQLREKGELTGLRGLMYFTDGFGTYPAEPTPYETAFVFCRDQEWNDKDVPEWALKLFFE